MSNEKTRVAPLFRNAPCSLGVATAAATPALSSSQLSSEVPLAVTVIDERGQVVGQAYACASEPLVIGRHERCGLRLDNPEVALRQLLVCSAWTSLGLETTLWDLRTELPMMTAVRELATTIVAYGSFAVTFGRWTVVARAHASSESQIRVVAGAKQHKQLSPGTGETTVTRVKPLGYLGE